MTGRTVMVGAALCAALAARAEEVDASAESAVKAVLARVMASSIAADRSWLYNDPARIASPGRAIGLMRVSYGGDSPTRPFAGNLAAGGALVEVGGEIGLFDRVSAVAIGAQGEDGAGSSQTGALLGLRWSVLPPAARTTALVLSAGVLRELQGNSGLWVRASLGQDLGRARLAASVHAERLFAAGRDSIDMMASAGATIRVLETVRAGIEYVGQDLEGMLDDHESEGGARHLLGPVVSAAWLNERLSATAGPAVALGAGQTHALGRVAVSYQF